VRILALLTSLPFLALAAPAGARSFDLVGARWSGGPSAHVELRAHLRSGRWTRWAHADSGQPMWARAADGVQVRRTRAVKHLRLHFLEAPHVTPVARAARAPLPLPTTGAPAPPIIPRAAWDPGNRCRPRTTPGLGNIQAAFVHHTVSLNGYSRAQSAAMVLGICLFHRDGNGWNDMGYNFLVDRYGQVFEGRAGGIDQPVVGAQAGGFNIPSTGVSMIGDFSSHVPPKAAMTSLAKLLAWKLSIHGVPATGRTTVTSEGGPSTAYRAGTQVSLNRISGHRDADLTACPGLALYRQLPALRRRVARLEGPISQLSLSTSGPAVAYGSGLTVSGTLTPASGGEAIEIRELAAGKEHVVASALTAPDGTWSAAVPPPTRGAVLRAVYAGGSTPGTISNVAFVSVTPVLSLIANDPEQGTVSVSGTVQPRKPLVSVVAYRGGRQVGARRLAAADGDFQGAVRVKATPDRLVAQVPADSATGSARIAVKLPTSQP
jgi:hypothetical protein